MKNNISRRTFIKRGTSATLGTFIGASIINYPQVDKYLQAPVDISVVQGLDTFSLTVRAVDILGGINKFVKKSDKVGLLINSVWDHPGSYTNPDVAIAVAQLCYDAGVKEIYSIESAREEYWKRSSLFNKYKGPVQKIKSNEEKKKIPIAKGISLKEAEISRLLLECDVLINIPIVKHHQGTSFTANLKNMMGACSDTTNRFFHMGSGAKRGYDDTAFLSRCIADLNLVRKPDLCIVDATEVITTNGPAGPGQIAKHHKVVAGINPVSVDAFCASILGLNPQNVEMIKFASEYGLGEIDYKKLAIKETKI